jgi:hypothetical protein
MADDEPHSEVEYAISDHVPLDDVALNLVQSTRPCF